MNSLKFMVEQRRIWLYGFVIICLRLVFLPSVGVVTNRYSLRLMFPPISRCRHQTDHLFIYLYSMYQGIEFFTATCLNWQPLLLPDERKDILMSSLKFMVEEKRIWLYGFVIMPNHIHLMWRRQDDWINKSTEQMFLKFTAQQIKFKLIDSKSDELGLYKSTQTDRQYHFWERRPYKATMYNRSVAKQKIDYMHYNPVKAGLCNLPEEYKYSSARYYELNQDEWGFITHYAEHL